MRAILLIGWVYPMGSVMMRIRPVVSGLCFLLLGYGAVHVVSADAEVYPLEYFALREVVSSVTVSPDGERLAMLKILSRTGNPIGHAVQ